MIKPHATLVAVDAKTVTVRTDSGMSTTVNGTDLHFLFWLTFTQFTASGWTLDANIPKHLEHVVIPASGVCPRGCPFCDSKVTISGDESPSGRIRSLSPDDPELSKSLNFTKVTVAATKTLLNVFWSPYAVQRPDLAERLEHTITGLMHNPHPTFRQEHDSELLTELVGPDSTNYRELGAALTTEVSDWWPTTQEVGTSANLIMDGTETGDTLTKKLASSVPGIQAAARLHGARNQNARNSESGKNTVWNRHDGMPRPR